MLEEPLASKSLMFDFYRLTSNSYVSRWFIIQSSFLFFLHFPGKISSILFFRENCPDQRGSRIRHPKSSPASKIWHYNCFLHIHIYKFLDLYIYTSILVWTVENWLCQDIIYKFWLVSISTFFFFFSQTIWAFSFHLKLLDSVAQSSPVVVDLPKSVPQYHGRVYTMRDDRCENVISLKTVMTRKKDGTVNVKNLMVVSKKWKLINKHLNIISVARLTWIHSKPR